MLLCESGELYVCGSNFRGQLGLGHRGDRIIFTRVEGLPAGERIKQLVCGDNHTMLLCESGELYACGRNGDGQLGLGHRQDRDIFTRVKGLPFGVRIKQLVCGWIHTMLLCESGALYACGDNCGGQLGLGDEKGFTTFTRVEGLPAGVHIKQLVCGEYHTTLLCESGALYACGWNWYDQLGLGHGEDRDIFTRVAGLPVGMRIKQLVCGGWCPMLLYESGALYACGSNRDGQLGLGDKENRTTFTRVGSGLPKWYWANISRNNETPSMSIS